MIEKRPTGSGELNTASAPRQQLDADLVFQIPDLATERRLRRMEPPFGGECEAALLGDGNEIAKMPQLHTVPCLPGMASSL